MVLDAFFLLTTVDALSTHTFGIDKYQHVFLSVQLSEHLSEHRNIQCIFLVLIKSRALMIILVRDSNWSDLGP